MASPLDRLYLDLTAASGVSRVRDPRLELLAMDRALAGMYEVGTGEKARPDGTQPGITHPIPELLARTYPHRAQPSAAVHENAIWSYETSWQDDFVQEVVNGWTSSAVHRDNLERITDTHWGIGYHIEPPRAGQTNNRIYVIAVFTTKLAPLMREPFTLLSPERGYQFSAMGAVLASKHIKPKNLSVKYDVRMHIPGRGPHVRIASSSGFKNYWVPE